MTLLQYIASYALLGLGGLVASINGWILFRQLLGRPSPSAAPLIGGIFLLAGALLFPGGTLRPWAVIGLFLDYGCLPYLILASISLIQEARRYAKRNRILSLHFEANATTGEILVYPNDECIYKWAARDGCSRGSMVMKVDAYTPNKTLKLSIEDTAVVLGVHDGSWQLESEQGWHNPVHSLDNCTITQLAANKTRERER